MWLFKRRSYPRAEDIEAQLAKADAARASVDEMHDRLQKAIGKILQTEQARQNDDN